MGVFNIIDDSDGETLVTLSINAKPEKIRKVVEDVRNTLGVNRRTVDILNYLKVDSIDYRVMKPHNIQF
jgi:hypothetical protein